jgi:hypothetical protein
MRPFLKAIRLALALGFLCSLAPLQALAHQAVWYQVETRLKTSGGWVKSGSLYPQRGAAMRAAARLSLGGFREARVVEVRVGGIAPPKLQPSKSIFPKSEVTPGRAN